MASAAREEKQKQAYEGLGAGGKFRKTPFRRTTQATPYDRPPTTLRNPGAANDGWLSKLVDPAQRLISASAHRLFSSVFRKRLPPPQSHSTGVNHEAKMKDKEEVTMDVSGVLKGTIDQCSDPSHPSTTDDGGKLTALEQILEQTTFTRSEIDRLITLLHSRTVDMPVENLEKRSEGIPSKSAASHDGKEEFPKTPLLDKKGIDSCLASCLASNPVVSTSVLDEDVASPAELAKAYMGSRPSKVSLSMLGLRSQTHHEDSPILSSVQFPSKSPMMSLVPRNSDSGMFPLITYFEQCTISFKFLDNAHNNNKCNSKLDVSADHVIPDARDFTSQKQDKVRENGPLRIGALSDSSTILINGADSATETKDILLDVKTTVSAASNSVHPPQKKWAFKMSAHEDFLDLDDDDDFNGVASDSRGKADATSTKNIPVFSEVKTSASPTVFAASWQPGSSSAAATTISATVTFGGSTVSSTNNNSGSLFRSSNGASSTSMFSFTSTAPTSAPSQPPFGNSNPAFPFGSPGNNDQMNMEDSMAEDTNQASTPTAPGFGQQPVLNSQSASVFGGTPAAPAASPFQFAGQQNLTNPQNPNPFQASGSLGASQGLGGSFSVFSSGGDGDKSHRRIIKVKRRPREK